MNTREGSVWKRNIKTDNMDQTHLRTANTAYKNKKIQRGRAEEETYNLVKFEELPEYMKDNDYILNYYRANWPLKQALFSIFRWHNETLNIWTHLIGFVVFVGLTFANLMYVSPVADLLKILTWSFPSTSEGNVSHNSKNFFPDTTKLINLNHSTTLDPDITPPAMAAARWPFLVFLGGAMFCLLSSSICHVFCCHSHHLNIQLLRFDYVGIVAMIITSFFPPIYYIFQCSPHWQFLYLGGISIMGIFTIVTLLSPILSTGKFRSFRTLLFVAMGLFGIVPAVHAVIVNWHEPQRNITLAYELAMALFYLIGAVVYVSRVPERWRPGWFDIAGQSHQIFHVFVVMGALAHYGAALVFLDFRSRTGCD